MTAPSPLQLLDAVINAAGRARAAAIRDEGKPAFRQYFYTTPEYAALLKAFYSLSEIDAVWNAIDEVARQGGFDVEEAA